MPDPEKSDVPLFHLQTDRLGLIEAINELHTLGLGQLVCLPHLVFCGSKSDGRRSVIEGISCVRFPVRSDLYTRFVTKIILRRHPTRTIKVTIEPLMRRNSDDDPQQLKTFMSAVHDSAADHSASPIEQAMEFMESVAEDGFSDNIVKVDVSGPDKPDLTLIDLPGAFFPDEKGDEDPKKVFVRRIRDEYMTNPCNIIVAVRSVKLHNSLQRVIDLAKKYDQGQSRILAIVTHLDKIEARSDKEESWLKIVKKGPSKSLLGLHLLYDPSYETCDESNGKKNENEEKFFSQEGWNSVAKQSRGIETLRCRLNALLANHVQSSLPGVVSEIDKSIQSHKAKLAKLSTHHQTIQQHRALLFHVSSGFERITEQALSGMYINDFFATSVEDGQSKTHDVRRLRAVIRELSEDFADIMESAGCQQFIHGVNNRITSFLNPANPFANITVPEHKSRAEFEYGVSEQMRRERGIEFPGNANPLLVGRLFREQSRPWEGIARAHVLRSWECIRDFVLLVLDYLTGEQPAVMIMHKVISPQLEAMKANLLAKVDELTAHYKRGHPMPIGRNFPRGHLLSLDNNYFAKMQDYRNYCLLANLQQALPFTPNNTFTVDELKTAIQSLESSNNQSAVSEIVGQMQLYYNNALLIFIDNIATLAIENCLLHPLAGIFTTQTISDMEDSQIEKSFTSVRNTRDILTRDLEKLRTGAKTLKKFSNLKETIPSTRPSKRSVFDFGSETSSSVPSILAPQGILFNGTPPNPFGVQNRTPLFGNQTITSGFGFLASSPQNPAPVQQSPFTRPNGWFDFEPNISRSGVFGGHLASCPSGKPKLSAHGYGAPVFARSTTQASPGTTASQLRSSSPPAHTVPNTHGFDARESYFQETDPSITDFNNRFETIVLVRPFHKFSQEELRWADYQHDFKKPRGSAQQIP